MKKELRVCLYAVFFMYLSLGGVNPLVSGKWFDRIIIFVFENTWAGDVDADTNFSYFNQRGVHFTNYFGVTHPSQPNYIAQTSGDYSYAPNNNVYNLSQSNVADLLEAAGVTWKTYADSYPGNCDGTARVGPYYRKHNPFISYDNIRNDPIRCAKIVSAVQLDYDLSNETLPQFMYFAPDINNDGHDTGYAFAGNWIRTYLDSREHLFPNDTVFFLTWDEDDSQHGNQISGALWGPGIPAHSYDDTHYDHYSFLRTIEDNWSLGNLGRNDATAIPFSFNFTLSPSTTTTTGATTTTSSTTTSTPSSSSTTTGNNGNANASAGMRLMNWLSLLC